MEPVTPFCPVGREPRKPCGAGLSVTQSGAITTPNGRLATTQGTARFDLTTQSRYRVAPRLEGPLDISSSWAGQLQSNSGRWERTCSTIRPHQALGLSHPLQFLQDRAIVPTTHPAP